MKTRRTYADPKQEGFDFGGWGQYRAQYGAPFTSESAGGFNYDRAREDRERRERQAREQEAREKQERESRKRQNRESRRRWQYTGRDPREVLEVGAYATQTEIRASWLRLVKVHHPDHGGDAEKFREVQAAFERLRTRAA
jgi:hypothetical protein